MFVAPLNAHLMRQVRAYFGATDADFLQEARARRGAARVKLGQLYFLPCFCPAPASSHSYTIPPAGLATGNVAGQPDDCMHYLVVGWGVFCCCGGGGGCWKGGGEHNRPIIACFKHSLKSP